MSYGLNLFHDIRNKAFNTFKIHCITDYSAQHSIPCITNTITKVEGKEAGVDVGDQKVQRHVANLRIKNAVIVLLQHAVHHHQHALGLLDMLIVDKTAVQ